MSANLTAQRNAAALAAVPRDAFVPETIWVADDDGYPDAAPYDRVIATGAITTVPPARVEQTRIGGRIATPRGATFHRDRRNGHPYPVTPAMPMATPEDPSPLSRWAACVRRGRPFVHLALGHASMVDR
ncbi:hypothetical protein AB0L06_42515 [Spirillospora sp. NPDC052269]